MPTHEDRPPGYYTTHLVAARVENARWLTTVCGLTPAQAADRLGVSKTCIEKDLAKVDHA